MNAMISLIAGSLLGWLADYYLLATLLLVAALAASRWVRQPAHRIMIAWTVTLELIVLAVVCALPMWPRISLIAKAVEKPAAEMPAAGDRGLAVAPTVAWEPAVQKNPAVVAPVEPRVSEPAAPPVLTRPRLTWSEWLAVGYLAGAGVVGLWLCWGAAAAMWVCRQARPAASELQAVLSQIVQGQSGTGPFFGGAGHLANTPLPENTDLSPLRHSRQSGTGPFFGGTGHLANTPLPENTDLSPLRRERLPRLLVSSHVANAVALGVLRPTIVLPAELAQEGLTPTLRAVLAHEWAHIRHRDLWLLALGRCVLLVLFAHPLLWWLRRAIRNDQELLADAAAAADNRPDYAEELLHLTRLSVRRSPVSISAAVGIWEGPSQLSRRIAMLLDETFRIEPTGSRRWKCRALGVLVIFGAACSLVTLQPARSADAPAKPTIGASAVAEPSPAGEQSDVKDFDESVQLMVVYGDILLGNASAQEKHGFTKEQAVRLREIYDNYEKATHDALSKPRSYTLREYEALNQKSNQLLKAAFKQIETTLTAEQLKSLRTLTFRWRAGSDVCNRPGEFLDSIGITQEQKKQLRQFKFSRAIEERLQREHREVADRTLAVLNPQQSERIRSEVEQFYHAAHEPIAEKPAVTNSGTVQPATKKAVEERSAVLQWDVAASRLNAESDDDAPGFAWALPIYAELGKGAVRKTLVLTVDQRKQLQMIAEKYCKETEGPASATEMDAKRRRLAAEGRRRIEALLTPQQLTTLKEIVFLATLPDALADSKLQAKMQLSEEQKEKLSGIRRDARDIDFVARDEAYEKAFQLLTPEQQEKLRRMHDERGRIEGAEPSTEGGSSPNPPTEPVQPERETLQSGHTVSQKWPITTWTGRAGGGPGPSLRATQSAQSASESPITTAPPLAATLEQWLEGKEVVEVCFAGPHIEPLKLRDSLHTKVSEMDQDFRLSPGEGGGHGSFIQVVMKVTPDNTKRLMELQSELAPRQYIFCPDHTRVWSTVGDPAKRAQARQFVPEVLSAFENSLAKYATAAKFTPRSPRDPNKRGGFNYDLGEGNTGSVRIADITPLKTWETELIPDQSIHFPQLGLMVTLHYRSGLLRDRTNLSPTHLAIRKALRNAVEPLLKLEPGATVTTPLKFSGEAGEKSAPDSAKPNGGIGNGIAGRGNGQRFRMEAAPGNQVQGYVFGTMTTASSDDQGDESFGQVRGDHMSIGGREPILYDDYSRIAMFDWPPHVVVLPHPAGNYQPGSIDLPVYHMLMQASVQNEIKLTTEQKKKLQDISSKYWPERKKIAGPALAAMEAEMKSKRGNTWSLTLYSAHGSNTESNKAKPEGSLTAKVEGAVVTGAANSVGGGTKKSEQVFSDEVIQKLRQQTADARKEIEAVLTPEQLRLLKAATFRTFAFGSGMMFEPGVLKKVAATAEQQEELKQLEPQLQKEKDRRMKELRREKAEKLLAVLTPEQRAQIHESIALNLVDYSTYPYPNLPHVDKKGAAEELGLSAAQESKVRDLMNKYWQERGKLTDDMQAVPHADENRLREIGLREKQLTAQFHDQIEVVLTPEQLALFKDLAFQNMAVPRLQLNTLKRFGATDEQKAAIQQIADEFNAKPEQVYGEMTDKALKAFTPPQQEALRAEMDRRGW